MNAGIRAIVRQIRSDLSRLGSRRNRQGIRRFFKPDERVESYGVAAPELQRIARGLGPSIKNWSVADRDLLCEELWRGGSQEEGGIVCYLYRRFAKSCGAREFRMFSRWLDTYVHNWAHTDGVALWLVGACVENDPALIATLGPWTRSRNRWKRRAAAVAMVYPARRGKHSVGIFGIAQQLLGDPDEMVQKGVGWLLKETYPKRRLEVMEFLLPRRADTTRLVLRYAAEKMTPADKRRLLR